MSKLVPAILLLSVSLLAFGGPVQAAVAFVEAQTGQNTGSGTTVTSASLTGVTDHLYLAAISTKPNVNVTAVSGLGLTWTPLKEQCGARAQTRTEVWYAIGTPTGNGTVQATLASTPSSAVIAVARYSGVDTASPIGNSVTANTLGVNGACSGGTDTSSPSVNLTTTQANSFALGAIGWKAGDTFTKGAGYTKEAQIDTTCCAGSDSDLAIEDKLVASPTTLAVNASLGGTSDWVVVAVEIKEPAGCGTVPDASYVAANAQSGQAIVYWASSDPALILRKTNAAFVSAAPANGTSYTAGNTINDSDALVATVIYDGASAVGGTTCTGTSCTQTSLTNGTTYAYKVFPKSGTCYAAGIEVNAVPTTGTPAWSYMMAGGALRAGIAGEGGALYTSGNPSRMISLNTTNGTQSWTPVATNAAIQGWLTPLPSSTSGGVKSLQTSTVTMSPNPRTITLSPSVDSTKAFVVCSYMSASSAMTRPVTCELSNTQLTITSGAAFTDTTVRYHVVEFTSGVSVQRNLETMASGTGTINKTITQVDLSKSFVLVMTRSSASTSSANDARWLVRARLTSTTNLELTRGQTDAAISVAWQVIQMDGASVQRDIVTIPAGASSATDNIPTSVDTTKSFLVFSWKAGTGTAGVEARYMTRGEITSSTLLTFTRGSADATANNTVDIAWEVVTLNDGSTVRTGTPITGSGTTLNQGITAVDTTRSIPLIYTSGGAEPNTSDFDKVTFTATLSAGNNLQIQRTTSSTNNSTSWFVIQFPTGGTSATVIGGDQSGRVYSVDPATGATNTGWPVTLTGADAVQAPVVAQLRQYADSTFQGTYATDVLFAASRNASTTNNKVFALKATDGTSAGWTFDPVNLVPSKPMDYIVGAPWVDYARNRLYVASRAGTDGTQQSLWVINTLTGGLVTSFALGHLETSPNLNYAGDTLYVVNTAGDLYALDLTPGTPALKWSGSGTVALGSAVQGFVWEDNGRLYFATADGYVWALQDPGVGAAPPNPASPVWKTAVTGPATPLLLSSLYVGSSDGKVRQLRLSDGVVEKQYTVGDGTKTVGDLSTEDGTQLYAPTSEGKIYKLPLPLP